MALTQSLSQMNANVRKLADIEGTNALVRHPDADVNEYVNRGLGALYRLLMQAMSDQRYLSSTTITTASGTTVYALPADFESLISIDLTANGTKAWLISYEMHERAALTDPSAAYTAIPFTYRLRGGNIEYLPTPGGAYTSTLWYVPSAPQLTGAQTFDTISRLDEYVIAYAAKLVGTKDKNWDLVGECRTTLGELTADVLAAGRARDKNSPSRVVDETFANRWGRRVALPRRWR